MHSLRAVLLAATAALVSVVMADYTIDPTTVPLGTRQRWCDDETSTCPIICQQTPPGTTLVNTCDPVALTYGCLCGNDKQPNMTEYTLSLPYHICTQWQINCQTACGAYQDTCIAACTQDHPCGAQNPRRVNASAASATGSSPTASTTGDTVFTGPGGETAAGSGNDAAAVEMGSRVGLALAIGALTLGFGIV